MASIISNEYRNATIMKIFYEKDNIDFEPEYQRLGNIWSISKKQLLIDSIINEYDIPKIYFHEQFPIINGKKYAVVDGRQRLEAIFGFIKGEFSLSEDIEYIRDKSINITNLNYEDLATKYPIIKINFDSFVLPIIIIQTQELDLIEEMFSRLNDGVLLNAAEKRNAFGGAIISKVKDLVKQSFFRNKLKITNKRFQHYEIATRFLLIEERLSRKIGIDTSKGILDKFVKDNKKMNINSLYQDSLEVLDLMNNIFSDEDNLLKRQGDMVIYYLLFKLALENNEKALISRARIEDFQNEIRIKSGQDEDEYNQDYITYYNYSQQGTNGFSNIKTRLKIMMNYLGLSNKISRYDYLFKV